MTGLYDFSYREYDPVQGRWISPDPAGLNVVDPMNPQTWNRYGYVMNAPLNNIDPNGLAPCPNFQLECPASGDASVGIDIFDLLRLATRITGYIKRKEKYPDDPDHDPPIPVYGNLWMLDVFLKFGVRAPGQTWSNCMSANVNNYSMGGAAELAGNVATGTSTSYSSNPLVSTVTGNGVAGLMFGGGGDAAQVGLTSAPDLVKAGMGTVTTYGRNSTKIMALNIARSGGASQALSSASRGARGFLGSASSVLSLGLKAGTRWAIDVGLTGAEAVGCKIPRGY